MNLIESEIIFNWIISHTEKFLWIKCIIVYEYIALFFLTKENRWIKWPSSENLTSFNNMFHTDAMFLFFLLGRWKKKCENLLLYSNFSYYCWKYFQFWFYEKFWKMNLYFLNIVNMDKKWIIIQRYRDKIWFNLFSVIWRCIHLKIHFKNFYTTLKLKNS